MGTNRKNKIDLALPEGISATGEKAERIILERLNAASCHAAFVDALRELVSFYSSIQKLDLAQAILQAFLATTDDLEKQACCYHWLGQFAEDRREYDAALEYYVKGLALKPSEKFTAYFLDNNTGYCLNVLGKHAEAEHYCRLAIQVDSRRANAFKNLGISLAGQNDTVGAAWAWIEGIRADARDARSLCLLQNLLTDNPALPSQFPGIEKELVACSKAVQTALRTLHNASLDERKLIRTFEICRLKYIPTKGFLQLKDGVERDISAEKIERLYTEEALGMLANYPNTCAIVGEDKTRTSPKEKDTANQIRPSQSRSDYWAWRRSLLPCLILKGHTLERVEEN